jgi:hypothetical protein
MLDAVAGLEPFYRDVSQRIFGNGKYAEIVLAVASEREAAAGSVGPLSVTAQQLAVRSGVAYSLVRDVLIRMAEAGILIREPKAHARAVQFYTLVESDLWTALVGLAQQIVRPT